VDSLSADANAWHDPLRIAFLALVTLLPSLLYADGGALQMRVQDAGLVLTAFTSPVPLRVGMADVSVLVQRAVDQSPVMDGEVTLRLSGPQGAEITFHATHAQATNKLLYAANVNFASAGDWTLKVNYRNGRDSANAVTKFAVLPEAPLLLTYWPDFAVVPVGLMLFALNQWLKAKRNIKRAY
jgi:hypothetical protein